MRLNTRHVARYESLQWKARWIWISEGRTLVNAFLVFRRHFEIASVTPPLHAHVSADSRYQLYVNGRFVCRGPAPFDPRYQCFDTVDLSSYLRNGTNTIAALVVHYGQGDGLSIEGVPGFLFQLDGPEGRTFLISDGEWRVTRSQAWRRSVSRRSFTRSLQEDFSAERSPEPLLSANVDDSDWEHAQVLDLPPGIPTVSMLHPNRLMGEFWPPAPAWRLEPRGIPLMVETPEPPQRVLCAGTVHWPVAPEDYYDHALCGRADPSPPSDRVRTPGAHYSLPCMWGDGVPPVRFEPRGNESAGVLLDFGSQKVGFLQFRLRAEAGTVVELVWDEKRPAEGWFLEPEAAQGNWLRYRCTEGDRTFTSFDYETFRYVQVLVRNGCADLLDFQCVTRRYPFEERGSFECSDPLLNEVWEVARNTLRDVAQDTLVDNNWRERQQYSGEGDPAKLGIYYAFGDPRLPRRMIRQYAQGQLASGQMCACWPSWDKLYRRMQGAMGVDCWRLEIVGHSLMWVVGLWRHVLFTGETSLAEELCPNVRRLLEWCSRHASEEGLLSAEGWEDATFWVDHAGFERSVDWVLPTNLYYLWALEAAAEIEAAGGHEDEARARAREAERLKTVLRRKFWDSCLSILTDPVVQGARETKAHEITQSLAVLLGVAPDDGIRSLLSKLDRNPCPFSPGTPPTAVYRYWALSKYGCARTILDDLRDRWAGMPSFKENRTFGETWDGRWCRCQFSVGPLFILSGEILGVRPLTPGFETFAVDPKLGDLEWVKGRVPTPAGEISVCAHREKEEIAYEWEAPAGLSGTGQNSALR